MEMRWNSVFERFWAFFERFLDHFWIIFGSFFEKLVFQRTVRQIEILFDWLRISYQTFGLYLSLYRSFISMTAFFMFWVVVLGRMNFYHREKQADRNVFHKKSIKFMSRKNLFKLIHYEFLLNCNFSKQLYTRRMLKTPCWQGPFLQLPIHLALFTEKISYSHSHNPLRPFREPRSSRTARSHCTAPPPRQLFQFFWSCAMSCC